MLMVSAGMTFICSWFMTEGVKYYGSSEIKTYSDCGKKIYGSLGQVVVFAIFYVNQYCTCVSYVIFFLSILHEHFEDVEPYYFVISLIAVMVTLVLSLRSMRDISFLQSIALVSQVMALVTMMGYSLNYIQDPPFEKSYTSFDFNGLPRFFGVCTFAFEGNALSVDIYRSMENKRTDFNMSLATGLSITTFIFQVMGILLFNAYAQYTRPVVLNHLPVHDNLADTIKFLYLFGIMVGFLLQIMPIFLHFERRVNQNGWSHPTIYIYSFRAIVTMLACVAGFYAGNFATFLNLQGAVLGVLISYILPSLFFLSMLNDMSAKRDTRQ